MGRGWRCALAGIGAGFMATVSLAAAAAGLPPEVEAALRRAKVPREAVSVWVEEVGASRPKLEWRADQPANPASLMKLLTTYAGLDLLGPAWTWATPVWLQGSVKEGVLDGNLVIKGSGDPKLVLERLWLMLRRVQQLGVREIRGDIVLDRSAFTVPDQNPADFDGEPLRPYNVVADALLLNYKSMVLTFTPDALHAAVIVGSDTPLAGVRIDALPTLVTGPCDDWRAALKADMSDPQRLRFTGSYAASCGEKQWPVAYADPKAYNARALAGLWREMGGVLGGTVRDGTAPATPPNFELRSPPLADVVREINKYSNNMMAQQLFLTLGLVRAGSGTPEAARRVVSDWVGQRFGAAASTSLAVDNGSGLSRSGRVSAHLLGQVLQSAWAGPVMSELMSSLPISGTDGTLRKTAAASGRAHLKTGSLNDVVGIAGYVLANSGRRWVVVGLVNHPDAAAARPALDALVQWAADQPAP